MKKFLEALALVCCVYVLVMGGGMLLSQADAPSQDPRVTGPQEKPDFKGYYKLDLIVRSGKGDIIRAYTYKRSGVFASKQDCDTFAANDLQLRADEVDLAQHYKFMLEADPDMTMQLVCLPADADDNAN